MSLESFPEKEKRNYPNVRYKIKGGTPVEGIIKCSGAKNLTTKQMLATLLTDEICEIDNVPHIGEVALTRYMLECMGAKIKHGEDGLQIDKMIIDPSNLTSHVVSLPDSRANRIPILLLSVAVARLGEADVPVVGGDAIGKRNVDFHIDALKRFGVEIEHKEDKYLAKRPNARLNAAEISLAYPSVGATETCLFLAVTADGTSVIKNIAVEPEIIGLITMLRSMGAIIFLNTHRELIIHGIEKLHGTRIYAMGDRLEAASWASMAAASDGRILVQGISPDNMSNFLSYYTIAGGGYKIIDEDKVEFFRSSKELRPVHIETAPFPGFSTDYQQTFAAMLTQADGISVIHETVYEKRLGYLDVLKELGAKVQSVKWCLGASDCRYSAKDHHHSALIQGPTRLIGGGEHKPIIVPDVRAGLCYIIASSISEGETLIIDSGHHLERGYGNLAEKLKDTNLNIIREEIIVK